MLYSIHKRSSVFVGNPVLLGQLNAKFAEFWKLTTLFHVTQKQVYIAAWIQLPRGLWGPTNSEFGVEGLYFYHSTHPSPFHGIMISCGSWGPEGYHYIHRLPKGVAIIDIWDLDIGLYNSMVLYICHTTVRIVTVEVLSYIPRGVIQIGISRCQRLSEIPMEITLSGQLARLFHGILPPHLCRTYKFYLTPFISMKMYSPWFPYTCI